MVVEGARADMVVEVLFFLSFLGFLDVSGVLDHWGLWFLGFLGFPRGLFNSDSLGLLGEI